MRGELPDGGMPCGCGKRECTQDKWRKVHRLWDMSEHVSDEPASDDLEWRGEKGDEV